jgi:hypothetical protein
LLQRRVGVRLATGQTLWAIARMLLAATVSAVATSWLRQQWLPALTDAVEMTVLRRAIDTLGALGLGCILFLALGTLIRLPESGMLLRYHRLPGKRNAR